MPDSKATVYIGPKRSYELTPEDKLWLGRALVGEGGKQISETKASAICWSLMNRFLLHRGQRYWPTFTKLTRAFCQCVNPRWMRGGDLAKKHAGTEYTTKERLDRREWVCSLSRSQLPDQVIDVVDQFSRGTLLPPRELIAINRPRISNWASYKGLKKKFPWGISFDPPSQKQFDWFFEDTYLFDGYVLVSPKGSSDIIVPLASLVLPEGEINPAKENQEIVVRIHASVESNQPVRVVYE